MRSGNGAMGFGRSRARKLEQGGGKEGAVVRGQADRLADVRQRPMQPGGQPVQVAVAEIAAVFASADDVGRGRILRPGQKRLQILLPILIHFCAPPSFLPKCRPASRRSRGRKLPSAISFFIARVNSRAIFMFWLSSA